MICWNDFNAFSLISAYEIGNTKFEKLKFNVTIKLYIIYKNSIDLC